MAESAKDGSPLVRQLEFQLDMKSSADGLYDIFRNKYELYQRLEPTVIKNVASIEADKWLWTFFDDKCGTWQNSVKGNEEMKSVLWTLLAGVVPKKQYKDMKVEYLFSPTSKGCTAKVTLTYEMKDITVPPPKSYMEFIRSLLEAADNK